MLLIPCPWCGERNDTEFVAGGESFIERPTHEVADAEWGEYLYFRCNTMGAQTERWFHAAGCRRWFNVVRDTVTNAITPASLIAKPSEAKQ